MHTEHNQLIKPMAIVNPLASEDIDKTIAKQSSQNHRYDYSDATGNILFSKQRYTKADGSKGYAYSHVNSAGVTVKTMPPFANGSPLYNLHRLTKHLNSTVYFVEGEKCVEALTKLKLLATTSGGASSDDKADFTPLAGRNVIIWPDNDDAGKGYMQRVTQKLLTLNASVSQLNIDAIDLPVKGDICDWLTEFALINERDATAADIEGLTLKSKVMLMPVSDLKQVTDRDALDLNEWQVPELLHLNHTAYDYPIDALPDVIKAAICEVLDFVQCPPALAASSALSALSVSAQHLANVRRSESLTSPVSLYFLTVAESGERKTACDGYFSGAIKAYENEQAELAKPDLKNYAAAINTWQAKIDGLTAKIKELTKAGKTTFFIEQELQDLTHDEPVKPRVPRLLYGDSTSEQLAYSLAHNYPSAAIISSEAGVVFGSHSMTGDGTMRNLSLLNVLWDGGTHTIDRRTSDSYQVRDVRLTMGLAVQYDTVKSFFERSKNLARGTGFAARFLIAQPKSTQGNRPFKEAPPAFPKLAVFSRRVTDMLNNTPLINDNGGINPPTLDLSTDAKTAWIMIYNTIELELKQGGDCVDIRDVASKAADNVARLAALFHVFEHGASGLISSDHIERAGSIVEYHLLEAKRFLGDVATPSTVSNAMKLDTYIIEYCKQHSTNSVAKSYVMQHSPLRDKNSLNDALDQLIGLNRVRTFLDNRTTMIALNARLIIL